MKPKNYKAIAQILRTRFVDIANNIAGNAVRENVMIVANDLADYFESNDAFFDRDDFMVDCTKQTK